MFIRAKEVRVIGDSGEQLGVMPVLEALKLARERETDLVEVAPNAQPPVCRMLDYGKFKYEQARKEREAHKRQTVVSVRQVRLRPKTSEHDLQFKTAQAAKLLDKGSKVKLLVLFRGREISHPQLGKEVLDKVAGGLAAKASVERPTMMEGRSMSMILSPTSVKKSKPKTEKAKEVADAQNQNPQRG